MDYQHHFTELKRGTILIAVLSQLTKPTYGYDLVRILNENGYEIEQNTLYPLLRRLEKQQIIKSELKMISNRERKYYHISAEGNKLLTDLIEKWQQTNEVLTTLISIKESNETN